MPYKQIGDYGVIGNGCTVALIGLDGALDWMCMPYMDSPSLFAALLDDRKGGRFQVAPASAFDSAQVYLPGTNILETRFRTPAGELELTDFMVADGIEQPDPSLLLRRVVAVGGPIEVLVECSPRFDYARRVPERAHDGRALRFHTGTESLTVQVSRPVQWKEERAAVELAAGEVLWLVAGYGDTPLPATDEECGALLASTRSYWSDWVQENETWRSRHDAWWQDGLDRAALVLKLLQIERTGAIAAAGTTSLPAIVGGERNWDYRLSWIRDTSMTLSALFELGHVAETEHYLGWLKRIVNHSPGDALSIVYRLQEPVPPGDEQELDHLDGYKNSRPVRIGQYVVQQRQHDIYGELFDAVFAVSRLAGKIRLEDWRVLLPLVEQVIRVWRDPDDGIWEARIGPRHYVHSKLMCWVALDRAIKIAGHYGFPGEIARWTREREAIRSDILARGYSAQARSFVQHYDTQAVDASLLLIPLTGFLPCSDHRVADTIARIERELLRERAMLRYRVADGLEGQEQGFMICLFWYVHCLILQGRLDEADGYLREARRCTNHLGLFGEQYEPRYQEITGNFPQAYSHIGYATAVLRYREARRQEVEAPPVGLVRKLRLVFTRQVLNPAAQRHDAPAEQPARAMKRAMNVVRGQFYDGHAQRVDYRSIRGSEAFRTLRGLAAQLAGFDPAALATDGERLAFWINVYNTLVVDGVVAFDIRDSVKEVPRFFESIRYRIGGQIYAAADIEHGILRGNAVPPYRLWRRFGSNDPRLRATVRRPDPRVHFALVCASRSCPPIEAYDPEHIDAQFDTAARTFINSTSRLDGVRLHVSEMFRWYRSDFGSGSSADLALLVARHLYDRELAQRIEAAPERIRLVYVPYDWRLNR